MTYQNKVFHTHTYIATHIRTLACHTRILIYPVYFTCCLTPYFDMRVLWYPNCYLVSPFFLHLEYKNGHTCLLLPLLHFSIIWNSQTKIKYDHFRNFDWLRKITHILDRGVYLKIPKQLFDISILVLSP